MVRATGHVDPNFVALLKGQEVHQDVINWLTHADHGCINVKLFANWVDNRDRLLTEILNHVNTRKDSRSDLAGLKQA